MIEDNYQITEFDPHNSSEQILESYFDLLDKLFAEIDSESVLPSRDERLKQIAIPNPVIINHFWLVKSKEKTSDVIGYAKLGYLKPIAPNYNEFKYTAGIKIHVLKEYRRKGVATALALEVGKYFKKMNVDKI